MKPLSSDRRLMLETRAAKQLRDHLATITDDTDAIKDTIEGQTNIQEAIHAVLMSMAEDMIMLTGLERAAEDISARRSRFDHRIEQKRKAILAAMEAGEITRLDFPEATVTTKPNAQQLSIVEEGKIPAEFWTPQPSVLDKRKLKAALDMDCQVPGAQLTNGGLGLRITKR